MIEKYNYEGDHNIGFSATVTPEYAIFPPQFKRKDFFSVEKTCVTFINRTRLPGLYTVGNSNCILVPAEITEHERSKLEESEIEFEEIETNNNALGNLILANDSGAIISPKIEHKAEKIEKALDVNVEVGRIADLPNPGSTAVANNKGGLVHREASEEEAKRVKETLELEDIDLGTVNLGSPYMGSGIICNDDDALVGENTSGPEIGRVDRVLETRN